MKEGRTWIAIYALFVMVSVLKLLLLAPGLYHSTDFEVTYLRGYVFPYYSSSSCGRCASAGIEQSRSAIAHGARYPIWRRVRFELILDDLASHVA